VTFFKYQQTKRFRKNKHIKRCYFSEVDLVIIKSKFYFKIVKIAIRKNASKHRILLCSGIVCKKS